MWHFSSCQPTPELDDEELLLEVPLLRLGTNGAATLEVGGDIVKSAARAPGKLPKQPNARAFSNSANTAKKRPHPLFNAIRPKKKLNSESWDRGMMFHW